LQEIDALTVQKNNYENSIRESNSRLETVTSSITESNDVYLQEIAQIITEKNGEKPPSIEGTSKVLSEERKIQDLHKDLAETKKNLNGKMIELQRVQQEIKVDLIN